MKKLINKLQKENSIGEDVKILKDFFSDRFEVEQEVQAVEHILKELKRFENMYEAEKRIHIVRNEQLARKQKLVIKCNELENENKELKKEIKSWKKCSAEQEENIIEKNNIICNLEFQIEKLQKENAELKNEHSCLINRIENKIDKLDYEMERAKRRNDQERANYCWDFLINFKNILESEE